MTYEIELTSPVPSKKNSKMLVSQGGRSFALPSKAYQNWHKDNKKVCGEFRDVYGTLTHVDKIEIELGLPDKRRRDLDNALSSILDLLVDYKVLSDDSFQVVPEIHITGIFKNSTLVKIYG